MIVFALRHADRLGDTDELSPAGTARAELLARMLAETGIRTAFCSDAARTRLTLTPLQKMLGAKLRVFEVPTSGGMPDHIQQIVRDVKALPGGAVAAIVGHTNTVGEIIEGLTGRTVDPIEETQFDKLFILSIPASGSATVAPMRYGAAT